MTAILDEAVYFAETVISTEQSHMNNLNMKMIEKIGFVKNHSRQLSYQALLIIKSLIIMEKYCMSGLFCYPSTLPKVIVILIEFTNCLNNNSKPSYLTLSKYLHYTSSSYKCTIIYTGTVNYIHGTDDQFYSVLPV